MEKNLSLAELREIEQQLKIWIKNERKFLSESFGDFHYRGGKFYFHIRGYFNEGIHLPVESITLDEFRDKKTGNPLTSIEKETLNHICESIIKKEKRLRDINNEIGKKYLGENFFNRKKRDKETLKEFIYKKAIKNKFQLGKTVKDKDKWILLREAQKLKLTRSNSVETISTTLSRLGYTKEFRKKYFDE
jgi:hypothetical protein